jgi:hypothetical protein
VSHELIGLLLRELLEAASREAFVRTPQPLQRERFFKLDELDRPLYRQVLRPLVGSFQTFPFRQKSDDVPLSIIITFVASSGQEKQVLLVAPEKPSDVPLDAGLAIVFG